MASTNSQEVNMCEPTTLIAISTALSVAGTAASAISQGQAADAQEAANARQADMIRQSSIANTDQSALQLDQEKEGAAQKIAQNNEAAAQAIGTARVSAGESGVSGLSVNALLQDFAGQSAEYNQNVGKNFKNFSQQNSIDRKNIDARSKGNQLGTPNAPDYLGAGLKIAGAGVSGYRQHKELPK